MHVVGQKALTEKCKPQCLAYCPTMDLVALATEPKNLHVFRLNGQRVFGVSCEDEDYDISWLRWKPNGEASRTSSLKQPLLTARQVIYLQSHALIRDYASSALSVARRCIFCIHYHKPSMRRSRSKLGPSISPTAAPLRNSLRKLVGRSP